MRVLALLAVFFALPAAAADCPTGTPPAVLDWTDLELGICLEVPGATTVAGAPTFDCEVEFGVGQTSVSKIPLADVPLGYSTHPTALVAFANPTRNVRARCCTPGDPSATPPVPTVCSAWGPGTSAKVPAVSTGVLDVSVRE